MTDTVSAATEDVASTNTSPYDALFAARICSDKTAQMTIKYLLNLLRPDPTEVDNLLTAIQSNGNPPSPCVRLPRKTKSGKVCEDNIDLTLISLRTFRFTDAKRKFKFEYVESCGLKDSGDVVCGNPYHLQVKLKPKRRTLGSTCVVASCQNPMGHGATTGLSFFKLPDAESDPALYRIYFAAAARADLTDFMPSHRICSAHFLPDDIHWSRGVRRLKPGAIPVLMLAVPEPSVVGPCRNPVSTRRLRSHSVFENAIDSEQLNPASPSENTTGTTSTVKSATRNGSHHEVSQTNSAALPTVDDLFTDVFADIENYRENFPCFLSCPVCRASKDGPCIVHMVFIEDHVPSLAYSTCPQQLIISVAPENQEKCVLAKVRLSEPTVFGPLVGKQKTSAARRECHFVRTADGSTRYYDLRRNDTSNWMKFVRVVKQDEDANVIAFQKNEQVYFAITKPLEVGVELRYRRLDKVAIPNDASTMTKSRTIRPLQVLAPAVSQPSTDAVVASTTVSVIRLPIPVGKLSGSRSNVPISIDSPMNEPNKPPQSGSSFSARFLSSMPRPPVDCLQQLPLYSFLPGDEDEKDGSSYEENVHTPETSVLTVYHAKDLLGLPKTTTDEQVLKALSEAIRSAKHVSSPAVAYQSRGAEKWVSAGTGILGALLGQPPSGQPVGKPPSFPEIENASSLPSADSLDIDAAVLSAEDQSTKRKRTRSPSPEHASPSKRSSPKASGDDMVDSYRKFAKYNIINQRKSPQQMEVVLRAVIDANPFQISENTPGYVKAWRALYSRLCDAQDVVRHPVVGGGTKLKTFVRNLVKKYRKDHPNAATDADQLSPIDTLVKELVRLSDQQAAARREKEAANPFPCQFCPLRFGEKCRLSYHMTNKHPEALNGKGAKKCAYCEEIFPNQSRLIDHKRRVHQRPDMSKAERVRASGWRKRANPIGEPSEVHDGTTVFANMGMAEVLQAVVDNNPYEAHPTTPVAQAAWNRALDSLMPGAPSKTSADETRRDLLTRLKQYTRACVTKYMNKSATEATGSATADSRVMDLVQRIYDMQVLQPVTGVRIDHLEDDFVEERLETVVNGNPLQFRKFSPSARDAWQDVCETLVEDGYLTVNDMAPKESQDWIKLRAFVQRHVDAFRVEAAAANWEGPKSRKDHLLQRIWELMKMLPVVYSKRVPFAVEKLQAVADANPFRFLDSRSARAVWISVYEGLVELKHIEDDPDRGWVGLKAFIRNVVNPHPFGRKSRKRLEPAATNVPTTRIDELIQKIKGQMQKQEADLVALDAERPFPCPKCIRRFPAEMDRVAHLNLNHRNRRGLLVV